MARSRRVRGSLLFPLVLIGAGVVLLLSNLGVIDADVWPELVRYWPVLVIALGIDILVSRPSFGAALGSLLFACLLLAAGAFLFHWFAPEAWITTTQTVSQRLAGATSADITLSCAECAISVDASADPSRLIEGTASMRRDERLEKRFQFEAGIATFALESEYRFPLALSDTTDEHAWALAVHPDVPIALSALTDGPITLDLEDARVTTIDVTAAHEACRITLPTSTDCEVSVSGRAVTILVPDGVGVRIVGEPTVELNLPEGYLRTDDEVRSPDYDTAAVRASIVLRRGTDRLVVDALAAGEAVPADEPGDVI